MTGTDVSVTFLRTYQVSDLGMHQGVIKNDRPA
jgi:hypothetical protein